MKDDLKLIADGLDELQRVVARINDEKGWNEDDDLIDTIEDYLVMGSSMVAEDLEKPRIWLAMSRLAMIAGEVAEAQEEIRGRGQVGYTYYNGLKPEGDLIELGDGLIRTCHYFERAGGSLSDAVLAKLAYNETRPHRHGGKAL